MQMFRILGALLISLMLTATGCMNINITAGTGIEKAGNGGGVRMCLFDAAQQMPNICICDGKKCNCPSPLKCKPGTSSE